MKYIAHDWDKKYDGVLYFVQRLEEMLLETLNSVDWLPADLEVIDDIREELSAEG